MSVFSDNNVRKVCYIHVTVPEGMYVKAYSEILVTEDKACNMELRANSENKWVTKRQFGMWDCSPHAVRRPNSQLILMPGHNMYVQIQHLVTGTSFWIYFEGMRTNLRKSFKVVDHTKARGYITLHGFDQGLRYAAWLRLSYILHLPRAHVVMLSFPYFDVGHCPSDRLELYHLDVMSGWQKLWRKCGNRYVRPNIRPASMSLKFVSTFMEEGAGFKCLFLFLTLTEAPDKLSNGLLNCSRHYEKFRHHLDCNLRVECYDKEDETEQCPFSSPLCRGAIHLQVRLDNTP